MSLVVAVPCALAAAACYGAGTAVQHAEAHTGTGRADAGGLVRLVRNPRWLIGFAGDGVGLALQVAALATGPVALIQPLLVVAVPVSLPLSQALGGRRPNRSDYLACLGILVGLGVFFWLLGDPGPGHGATPAAAVGASLVTLAAGAAICAALTRRGPVVRAATYGAVAGGGFGLAAVLLGGAATQWRDSGTDNSLDAVSSTGVWIPLLAACVVGGAAVALTQVTFQVGPVAAGFPANEATAPVVAVILGAALLGERVGTAPAQLVGYVLCLAIVLACTIRLAR